MHAFLPPKEYLSFCLTGAKENQEKAKQSFLIEYSDANEEESVFPSLEFHHFTYLPDGTKHGIETKWYGDEKKELEILWDYGEKQWEKRWYKNGILSCERDFVNKIRKAFFKTGIETKTCNGNGSCFLLKRRGLEKVHDCDCEEKECPNCGGKLPEYLVNVYCYHCSAFFRNV